MKKIILLTFLMISSFGISQNKASQILMKINNNIKNYCVSPNENIFYLNKTEKVLDVDMYQIPLFDVKITFKTKPGIFKGKKIEGNVMFTCEVSCIKDGEDYHLAIGIPFKSKKGAYEFIELIDELKYELNN